ncbi:MAG: hypothetical protein IJZ16_04960, partial [Clostridia bacterium]|nr:hypothetical protein [Clostridia bacterium]
LTCYDPAVEGANVTIISTVSGGKIESSNGYRSVYVGYGTAKVIGVELNTAMAASTLTLENVKITADVGILAEGTGNITILGNSSISGAEYDVICDKNATITLGEGVTFPDGLTVYSASGYKRLNTMLADGMAYWQGDNKMLRLTSEDYEISGGTVTVKAVCTHENEEEFTYTANTDGTTHVKAYQCCGAVVEAAEAHSGGEATCVAKAVCEICDGEYGEIDSTNHNFVNGTCSDCGKVKDIIGSLSSQIRFQRNADGSYANKFDVRTRAMISDEDFTSLVGSTNDEAAKNIKKVGFVYSINPDAFSTEDAKTVAMGGEVAGYIDAPVSYIQDADGYYMFTCLVKNIPSTDTNYTLVSYAYICVEDENGNEKWYFMDTQAEADFYSLYSTYYPVACEKYGWE